MIELRGKYNSAKVFADHVEESAQAQIIQLCNQEAFKDSKIRIMPDVHAGAGCVIGTSMTITDKVVPNLVGVDIGCGMMTMVFKRNKMDFEKLDNLIRKRIPHGFNVRDKNHRYTSQIAIETLRCNEHVNIERGFKSLGTLGGGNHFIEVCEIGFDAMYDYLVIHTGSRNIGLQTAKYYQKIAQETATNCDKGLEWLSGQNMEDYLHDMKILQDYAYWNRRAIAEDIAVGMRLDIHDMFETIHNYIDVDEMILRKGAVSANEGERILIPMNMRDGSLLCRGKGNLDWNWTAPHGAGRVMSRSKAKKNVDIDEFKKSMQWVWSTSVGESTLDESPMAYKPVEEITKHIGDTAEIVGHLHPRYNFKSS